MIIFEYKLHLACVDRNMVMLVDNNCIYYDYQGKFIKIKKKRKGIRDIIKLKRNHEINKKTHYNNKTVIKIIISIMYIKL